jgi:hypothetical protein
MQSEGVEIISNSSGSHHELKKLDTRVNLITQATKLVWWPALLSGSLLIHPRAAASTCMQTSKAAMVTGCTTTVVP